ncbi:MAG: RluA family pseudouridine synthase [Bacteroidales bacterium]|nr:RluA family pseudouridine synthase [Bacteroidales bacterium]
MKNEKFVNNENDNETLQEEIDDSSEELFEHHRILVDGGQSMMRLDKYLSTHIEGTSRNKIQQAAKAELIKVNERPQSSNYKIKPHDLIQIYLPREPYEQDIIPQNIPLDIVYEDDDIIVINKNASMVVHPAFGNWDGTLLNALAFHFEGQKDNNGNEIMPLLVHRIDKDTTGLLVVTKNEPAQFFLSQQFAEHLCNRTYTALVWGNLKEDEGTIEGNVGRNLKDRKRMDVFSDGSHGKRAITHWKVLKRFNYVTLVECKLETGRTHQIRVHFKSIGHPLFNDETYGGDQILKGLTTNKYRQFIINCFHILPRQALHATTLGFIHPTTFEKVFFSSNLPNDMQEIINKWDKFVNIDLL